MHPPEAWKRWKEVLGRGGWTSWSRGPWVKKPVPHRPGCPCLWSFWGRACVSQEESIWHKAHGGRDVEAQDSVFKGSQPIARAFHRVFLPGSSSYVLFALTLQRSGQRADDGHREGSRMRTSRVGPLPSHLVPRWPGRQPHSCLRRLERNPGGETSCGHSVTGKSATG